MDATNADEGFPWAVLAFGVLVGMALAHALLADREQVSERRIVLVPVPTRGQGVAGG